MRQPPCAPNASCGPTSSCLMCGFLTVPVWTSPLAISGHEVPPSVVLVSTADYRYVAPGCGARGFLLKTDLTAEALRDVLSETP